MRLQDIAVSGHLRLVKGKRGPRFYAKYRVPDPGTPGGVRQVQRKLGPAWLERSRPPAGYLTRKMAEAALADTLADARRGALPTVRTGATFGDVAEAWFAWVRDDRKRKPSTVRSYRSVLDTHLLPEFGHVPVGKVTAEAIDAYRVRLVKDGRSARQVNKLLIELGGIFNFAVRRRLVAANPCASVDRQPMRRSGDIDVLTPGEVEALATAAASEQDATLYLTAAFTGLRLGELRALRWGDIAWAHRLVHVRRSFAGGELGTPKSGRVRSVPLIDQAARALDALSQRGFLDGDGDLVFPGAGGGVLDDSALRRRFAAALDRAQLPRVRFHDLRHTFGTVAVRAFPLSDVKAFMGHADIATTMVYVHHVPRHDAADRLGRVVGEASPLDARARARDTVG
jgi:integrase